MAWHSKIFTFVATDSTMRVNHGIGQVPDVIIINKNQIQNTNGVVSTGGFSDRLYQMCANNTNDTYFSLATYYVIKQENSDYYFTFHVPQDSSIETSNSSQNITGAVRDCNDTSFLIGNSEYEYTSLTIDVSYDVVCLWNDGDINGGDSVARVYSRRMLGGYQIIDLKNVNLNYEDTYKIDGIYDIVKSNRKTTMFSNINIMGIKLDNVFASTAKIDNNFVANLYGNYLVIHEDDTISFSGEPIKQTIFYVEGDDL